MNGCVTNNGSDTINYEQASTANSTLGLAYLHAGQTSLAKETLLKAVHESPDSPQALDAMAYFWEKTGRLDLANQYYQKAVHQNPADGAALNNYAIFLCYQQDFKNIPLAEQLFVKAASLPNYLHTAQAYHNAGLCELTVNHTIKAKQYFEQAQKET